MANGNDEQEEDEYTHEPEYFTNPTGGSQAQKEEYFRSSPPGYPPIVPDPMSSVLDPSDYLKIAKHYEDFGRESDRLRAMEWQSYWNSTHSELDIQVTQIEVGQGKIEQIELLFKRFFNSLHSPICHLDRVPYITDYYWYMLLFHGDEELAREAVKNSLGGESFDVQARAIIDLVYKTSQIGYVEVLNLPNLSINFYLLQGQERYFDQVRQLAEDIESKMRESGFGVREREGVVSAAAINEQPLAIQAKRLGVHPKRLTRLISMKQLILDGKTQDEIAEITGVETRTIKADVKFMKEKGLHPLQ
ncbi:MAG: hypothetical protein KA314_13485 [Chloroflexi bacterium]|nr:hypothetical protein [Chloroflexota bacterium]